MQLTEYDADGSAIGNALKTREIKVGDIPVTLVEIIGTYVGGMGSVGHALRTLALV